VSPRPPLACCRQAGIAGSRQPFAAGALADAGKHQGLNSPESKKKLQ
jgi:hypothetical protein